MEQKEKELLIKDLCARLPYGVKCKYSHIQYIENGEIIDINRFGRVNINGHIKDICDIKPYLFPLSSMTEEQYYELQNCSSDDCLEHMELVKTLRECTDFTHWPLYEYRVIDLFNKNHFDYRGLIPMGLASDATGLNIY